MTTSTITQTEETTTYQVCVPVYVTCCVEAEPGLSDEEVLTIAKEDPTLEIEMETITEQVEDIFAEWVKPVAPIEVETLD